LHAYLAHLVPQFPGRFLFTRCVAHADDNARRKGLLHPYQKRNIDKATGKRTYDENGKAEYQTVETGNKDAMHLATTSSFTTSGGTANIRVALFSSQVFSARAPSGVGLPLDSKEYNYQPHKLWQHSWVGVVARTTLGKLIVIIYDSHIRRYPLYEPCPKSKAKSKQLKRRIKQQMHILSRPQQKFVARVARAPKSTNVWLYNQKPKTDNLCTQHACEYMIKLLQQGSDPIDLEGDPRLKGHVHLSRT
jgi:hypothetical protein